MLTFKAHVESTKGKLQQSLRDLSSVAHSEWGWETNNLRAVFFALAKSRLDYAAAA